MHRTLIAYMILIISSTFFSQFLSESCDQLIVTYIKMKSEMTIALLLIHLAVGTRQARPSLTGGEKEKNNPNAMSKES